ncbi:MAG: hypothetical protein ACERKD_23975 [Prolixibacteraceae bacterium]
MTQLLNDRHSSNVHESIVRRCMRLCRQVKNADEFATILEPVFNDFLQKRLNFRGAKENAENLYDTKVLMDTVLDDRVRDLSDACKKYDRNQAGSNVYKLFFPEGASKITGFSIDKEPEEVDHLILALQDLGAEHELAPFIPILQEAAAASRAAIAAHAEALGAVNSAKALVAIAKGNLNRQYEQVIYAASAKFGKVYSKRLFPVIKRTSNKRNIAENEETNS